MNVFLLVGIRIYFQKYKYISRYKNIFLDMIDEYYISRYKNIFLDISRYM